MTTASVTDAEFDPKVLKSTTPVLVDFWAPWCAPCKMAEPILEELSETYKGKTEFLKLNVDDNSQTPMKYGVMSIPTTILYKEGKEVGRQIGFAGKEAFENLLRKGI